MNDTDAPSVYVMRHAMERAMERYAWAMRLGTHEVTDRLRSLAQTAIRQMEQDATKGMLYRDHFKRGGSRKTEVVAWAKTRNNEGIQYIIKSAYASIVIAPGRRGEEWVVVTALPRINHETPRNYAARRYAKGATGDRVG